MFLVEGGGVGRRQWQTSMSVPPPGELQDMYLTRPDGEANHGLGAHKSTRTDGGSRKNSSSSGQPSVAPGSDIAEISKTRVCIVRPHQDPNCCGKCSVQKCFRSRRSLPPIPSTCTAGSCGYPCAKHLPFFSPTTTQLWTNPQPPLPLFDSISHHPRTIDVRPNPSTHALFSNSISPQTPPPWRKRSPLSSLTMALVCARPVSPVTMRHEQSSLPLLDDRATTVS